MGGDINMKDVEFWWGIVKILKANKNKDKEKYLSGEKILNDDPSWLFDPFQDGNVYGVEFTLKEDFSWTFLLKENSKKNALINGYFLLSALQEKFHGIQGIVQTRAIRNDDYNRTSNFYELVLPVPQIKRTIPLFNRIINLFYLNSNHMIKIYIFWEKDDSIMMENIDMAKQAIIDDFKIKIYITAEERNFSQMNSRVKGENNFELLGKLKSLTSEIFNRSGEWAQLKKVPENTWRDILSFNVFWRNLNQTTGRWYKKIRDQIPKEKMPGFITPEIIDFTIPKNLPLQQPFILKNENVKYLPISPKNPEFIWFGKILTQGILTGHDAFFNKDSFAFSCVIFGKSGTGKTYLLRKIIDEFQMKAPDVGILVLNYAKQYQDKGYTMDEVILFGTPEFKVPYFISGTRVKKSIKETSDYIAANLGMKNVVPKIISRALQLHYRRHHIIPDSLLEVFQIVKKYMRLNTYADELQTNLRRAIDNRVFQILDDKTFKKSLELEKDANGRQVIPDWYIKWRSGEKIFLDMTACEEDEKHFLTNAIFQMISTLTPDVEKERLKHLIVIDEAHQILEKALTTDPDDEEFVMKAQLKKNFTRLLREFRSKGLGMIIADNRPSVLFESVPDSASLKVLFRLAYPCNEIFTNDSEEKEMLLQLENRQALVMNGTTGNKYLIKTLDIPKSKEETSFQSYLKPK